MSGALSLKAAFETEFARRDAEHRARADAERRQQEQDLASAEALHAALCADGEFLSARGLSADIRRYTVSLDHADYRIAAYFDSDLERTLVELAEQIGNALASIARPDAH